MANSSTPNGFQDERKATICLSLVNGIGPRHFHSLLERFGSAANALDASSTDLLRTPGIGSKLCDEIRSAPHDQNYDQLIQDCHTNDIEIVGCLQDEFPSPLKEIYDPPSLLFQKGNWIPADSLAIAIVGARHATPYGRSVADSLARGLATAGFTIVSGLARGIDAAAHRGALAAGGRTIAVLGSGLQNIYPPEHTELANEIQNNGVLFSEFRPNQPPHSGAFPQRNRIITGLSLGVIVVEAAARSGALISARLAGEQNREVFAVPGNISSRMSRGCHSLIRDGATLVECIDDVIEQLGPLAIPAKIDSDCEIRHPAELKLTEQESQVLQHVGTAPTNIDSIILKTEIPVARILAKISVLEIRKLIRRVGGNRVVRI